MKNKKYIVGISVLGILGIFLAYYIYLPVINYHDKSTWGFVFMILGILYLIYGIKVGAISSHRRIKHSGFKRATLFFLGIIIFFVLGIILSSPVVSANRFQKLLGVENRDFSQDISELSLNQIPICDKETAILLGERKMGNLAEMVSQFEVSHIYTQFNYKGKPYRISPLEYASFFKWFTNHQEGLPGYMLIDMTTQNTEYIKLDKPIRYSHSDMFHRDIKRHLRFHYPTAIFDQIFFELDDEGTPYWICPIKEYSIGLFGGPKIKAVVLCNAQTGELQKYPIQDVPNWVDKAYSAELLVELYNYHSMLKHGYLNSIFGQRDCLTSTEGYNYIASEDDVWVYTGVTSVNKDESIVGFVMMNQRTSETRFYQTAGAKELSAMASAEGEVQHLGYRAAFPLLLNISNQPTYIITLKDDAGLVKKFALVNVEKYQIVSIGDTIKEAEKAYKNELKTSYGTVISTDDNKKLENVEVERVVSVVIEGNTHYYIIVKGESGFFDIDLEIFPEAAFIVEGSRITISYENTSEVLQTVHTFNIDGGVR